VVDRERCWWVMSLGAAVHIHEATVWAWKVVNAFFGSSSRKLESFYLYELTELVYSSHASGVTESDALFTMHTNRTASEAGWSQRPPSLRYRTATRLPEHALPL
jgi:hypothetical protein